MSSEKASFVKRKGHEDAQQFSKYLGIGKEYKSNPQAKKDVIDLEGHSHSIKSDQKNWQIFLFGKKRFENDFTFRVMNGISDLF